MKINKKRKLKFRIKINTKETLYELKRITDAIEDCSNKLKVLNNLIIENKRLIKVE